MDTKKIASIAGDVAIEFFAPSYLRAAYKALSKSRDDIDTAESKGVASLEKEASDFKVAQDATSLSR